MNIKDVILLLIIVFLVYLAVKKAKTSKNQCSGNCTNCGKEKGL